MKTLQEKKIEKLEERIANLKKELFLQAIIRHCDSPIVPSMFEMVFELTEKDKIFKSELSALDKEIEQGEAFDKGLRDGLIDNMDEINKRIAIEFTKPTTQRKSADSQSEIAKLVWSKLKYTQCHVDGLATSIIEIKEVWELISKIESIIKVKQDTIDLNVKTNMDLVKTIQKMISKDKQKLDKALEWYANETNREVIEFDDYDLHVCKVAERYASQSGYPKEFVEWLYIRNHQFVFQGKRGWLNLDSNKIVQLDFIHTYWLTNIKDK